jgi:putative component of membrane protein insertase Oxa1/YidC/SpoIIIJ protein YidD
MKPIKWTKSDAKRAAKMGWMLSASGAKIVRAYRNSPFKTDREAREFVCSCSRYAPTYLESSTCRKALLLCAGGGE